MPFLNHALSIIIKLPSFLRVVERVFICLLVLACVSVPLQANPIESTLLSCPDNGPYRTVGDPRVARVRMPVRLLSAIQKKYHGKPAEWYVDDNNDFAHRGHRVVGLLGDNIYLNYLVDTRRWFDLGAPEGIPYINEALLGAMDADGLKDRKRLKGYVYDIVHLHKYPQFLIMTKSFEAEYLRAEYISKWLKEGGPSKEDLEALCHDIMVDRDGSLMTIQFNIIVTAGAVQHWTLHGRMSKSFELEKIDIQYIHKEGTFCFPLAG